MRPISDCTAKQLIDFLQSNCGGQPKNFYVWIEEHEATIVLAHKDVADGAPVKSISACRICYGGKDEN